MTTPLHVSPRTDAAPMAFTAGEFIRGAIYAWLWFLLFSTLAIVPIGGVMSWIALIYTVPWSVGALILGSPLAYGLGLFLQHNPSIPSHAASFTAFAALIGIVTTSLAAFAPWSGLQGSLNAGYTSLIVAVCVSATIAVPLGWWQTARRALRHDQNAQHDPARNLLRASPPMTPVGVQGGRSQVNASVPARTQDRVTLRPN